MSPPRLPGMRSVVLPGRYARAVARSASATRTTCTIAATLCTRTMCAPPITATATAAAVPQSRSAGGRGACPSSRNDFRDGPDQQRLAQRREAREVREHRAALRRPAWRSRCPGRGSPAPASHRRRLRARAPAAAPPTPRRRRRRSPHRGTCPCGRPRMCISTSPAPVPATTSPSSGSYPKPLMSFTIEAPASMAAARDGRLVGVDGHRHPQSAPQPLDHRDDPGQLLRSRTRGRRRAAWTHRRCR